MKARYGGAPYLTKALFQLSATDDNGRGPKLEGTLESYYLNSVAVGVRAALKRMCLLLSGLTCWRSRDRR